MDMYEMFDWYYNGDTGEVIGDDVYYQRLWAGEDMDDFAEIPWQEAKNLRNHPTVR